MCFLRFFKHFLKNLRKTCVFSGFPGFSWILSLGRTTAAPRRKIHEKPGKLKKTYVFRKFFKKYLKNLRKHICFETKLAKTCVFSGFLQISIKLRDSAENERKFVWASPRWNLIVFYSISIENQRKLVWGSPWWNPIQFYSNFN